MVAAAAVVHVAVAVAVAACTVEEQGVGAEACHVAVAGAGSAAWRAGGAGGLACDAAASQPARTAGVQSAPCWGEACLGGAPAAAAWWADEGTQAADQGKGTGAQRWVLAERAQHAQRAEHATWVQLQRGLCQAP